MDRMKAMFPPKQGRIGISVKAGPSFPLVDFSDLFTTGFTGFVDSAL